MNLTIPKIYEIRKILISGISEPLPAQCSPEPAGIAHAHYSDYGRGSMEGATRSFACEENYQWSDGVSGYKIVTCLADGNWSSIAETCFCMITNSLIFDAASKQRVSIRRVSKQPASKKRVLKQPVNLREWNK